MKPRYSGDCEPLNDGRLEFPRQTSKLREIANAKVELAGVTSLSYSLCMTNSPDSTHLTLRPHPALAPGVNARLEAILEILNGREISAEFRYQSSGGDRAGAINEALLLPKSKNARPSRCDGLWEATCFELFLQPEKAAPAYWEINFSPAGDWNAYILSGYREGLRPEAKITDISKEKLIVEPGGVVCRFHFRVPLEISGVVHVGVTAVIETQNGAKSYWALAHAGPKPDFHLNQSFTHRLQIGTQP